MLMNMNHEIYQTIEMTKEEKYMFCKKAICALGTSYRRLVFPCEDCRRQLFRLCVSDDWRESHAVVPMIDRLVLRYEEANDLCDKCLDASFTKIAVKELRARPSGFHKRCL